jgi:hypothetical protein
MLTKNGQKVASVCSCEFCDYTTSKRANYEKHLTTDKHLVNIGVNKKEQKKVANEYNCTVCDYVTSKKINYDKHLLTRKHLVNFTEKKVAEKVANDKQSYSCSKCNKNYTTRVGLWKHNKICNEEKMSNNTNQKLSDMDVIMMLIKENSEFKNMMIEQQNTFLEIAKKGTNNIITTNTNCHNNNKTFNLQIFLNETCKDAMNIMDFVDQIVLSLNDLEETGRIGFAEGISNMILKRLKTLDVTQRPIHCSDLKRETLYIKDENKWEKEEETKPKLTKAVKEIAGKNINQIFEWQKKHPDYNDPDSKMSDKYMNMVMNVMAGGTEEEIEDNYEKIVRTIAKETTIDKDNYLV